MTLYLVLHTDGDIKLHDETGAVLFNPPDTIRESDIQERELIEAYKSANPNADLWSDSVRPYTVSLLTGDWIYRDLTNDNETVPWQ